MKKLIIFLILGLNFNVFSQTNEPFLEKNEDKINHISVGYIIGYSSNALIYEITKNKHIAFISGIGLSFLAGHLKEKHDKIYDKNDLLCTGIGGTFGSFTVRIIIGNKNRKINNKKL